MYRLIAIFDIPHCGVHQEKTITSKNVGTRALDMSQDKNR